MLCAARRTIVNTIGLQPYSELVAVGKGMFVLAFKYCPDLCLTLISLAAILGSSGMQESTLAAPVKVARIAKMITCFFITKRGFATKFIALLFIMK